MAKPRRKRTYRSHEDDIGGPKWLVCQVIDETVNNFFDGFDLTPGSVAKKAQWRDAIEFLFWPGHGENGSFKAEHLMAYAGLNPSAMRKELIRRVLTFPVPDRKKLWREFREMHSQNKSPAICDPLDEW